METTAVEVYAPPTLTPLHYAVIDFPPFIVALFTLGFLGLALWIGRNGYPHLRALMALDRTPTVSIASGATGLVRVEGHAFPGEPVPEGYAPPKHVWHLTSRYDTRSSSSMASSGTYSVGKILVRDATGECLIDPIGTLVVPGRSAGSVDNHMFSEATYRSEKSIDSGDPVLAIGTLRQKQARPDRPADDLGPYYVGTAGDADISGMGLTVAHALTAHVRGSVNYTISRARWTSGPPRADNVLLRRIVPAALHTADIERIHDVLTTLEAELPWTATRVLVFYRVNSDFIKANDLDEPRGLDGRFELQVNQALPFMGFMRSQWEMLVAVRNLFQEGMPTSSVYDEVLVVRPPTRVVGGLTVRF